MAAMTAMIERRIEPRQPVFGWAEIRQATTWGSWQILDLSRSGLRASGPVAIDTSRPVIMRLHVRGFTFEVDAHSAWQAAEEGGAEHGWKFTNFGPEAERRLSRALDTHPEPDGTMPLPAPAGHRLATTYLLAFAVAALGIAACALVLL